MEAKEFLSQAEKIDLMIENNLAEIVQWRNIAEGLSSAGESIKINGVLHNMDKVQTSKKLDKMGDAVVKMLEIIEEYELHIEELKRVKKEIASVIELLKPIEYDFLHKAYIQHLSLSQIAGMYRKSYSWATTVHSNALQSVQKILDERDE